MKTVKWLIMAIIMMVVVGCGGSGDVSSDTTNDNEPVYSLSAEVLEAVKTISLNRDFNRTITSDNNYETVAKNSGELKKLNKNHHCRIDNGDFDQKLYDLEYTVYRKAGATEVSISGCGRKTINTDDFPVLGGSYDTYDVMENGVSYLRSLDGDTGWTGFTLLAYVPANFTQSRVEYYNGSEHRFSSITTWTDGDLSFLQYLAEDYGDENGTRIRVTFKKGEGLISLEKI